jgi:hypothetical protein
VLAATAARLMRKGGLYCSDDFAHLSVVSVNHPARHALYARTVIPQICRQGVLFIWKSKYDVA